MKIKLLAVLILAATITGCSSKDVLKLNDAIVKANDELRVASEVFNNKMDLIKDGDYTSLETERVKIASLIELKLSEVDKLKADVPGGKDFKNAFVDYYKFEKEIYNTEYKEICTLKGEDSDTRLTEIATKMQTKADTESRLEAAIRKEQQNFAKKNNLKLQ